MLAVSFCSIEFSNWPLLQWRYRSVSKKTFAWSSSLLQAEAIVTFKALLHNGAVLCYFPSPRCYFKLFCVLFDQHFVAAPVVCVLLLLVMAIRHWKKMLLIIMAFCVGVLAFFFSSLKLLKHVWHVYLLFVIPFDSPLVSRTMLLHASISLIFKFMQIFLLRSANIWLKFVFSCVFYSNKWKRAHIVC